MAETEVKGAADRSGPASGRSEASGRASAVEAAGKAMRDAMAAARVRDAGLKAAGPTLQAAADRIGPQPAPATDPAQLTKAPGVALADPPAPAAKPDPAAVKAKAQNLTDTYVDKFAGYIEDWNWTGGAVNSNSRETRTDTVGLGNALGEMAKTDPAMAEAVRAEVEKALDPHERAALGNFLGNTPSPGQQIDAAVRNPLDGVTGWVKGTLNSIGDVAELAVRGMAQQEAGRAMMAEGLAGGLGLRGAADLAAQSRAVKEEVARTFDIPDLDLATPAQQGGAVIGTVVETAAAGAGLVKGFTGIARLTDGLVPTARAELTTTTALARITPGRATGNGVRIEGDWLRESLRSGTGAPVPDRIAARLAGRGFAGFRSFREAFWKEVAADPELAGQFTVQNQARMAQGFSPYAPASTHVGMRDVFELDHIEPLFRGGQVYDIDNIQVMTPRLHIEKSRHD